MEKNKVGSSWINHLSSWINNKPGHNFYYYFGLAVGLTIIQSLGAWIDGALPWGKFQLEQIFLAAATAFILGVIPYFDKQSLKAFSKYLPISNLDPGQESELRNRLSNMAPFPVLFASLIVIGVVYLLEVIGSGPYRIIALEGFPISILILRITYYLCWWCYGVFIYHTIHQLTQINRIYTQHTKVNLFQMKPLYGFSDLAALTAGSMIVLPYGFLVVNPDVTISDPIVLSMYIVFSFIALITFLLPQLGIHKLQQAEKDRLLDEVYQHYQALMSDLHESLERKEYDIIPKLNNANNMVEHEINTIKGISTWPWQPETIRWLFTALVLPLVMWLIQYLFGKILA